MTPEPKKENCPLCGTPCIISGHTTHNYEPIIHPAAGGSEGLSSNEYLRLVKWMKDDNREPAITAFTSGACRDAARAFEDYIKQSGGLREIDVDELQKFLENPPETAKLGGKTTMWYVDDAKCITHAGCGTLAYEISKIFGQPSLSIEELIKRLPEKKKCKYGALCGPNGDCDNCAWNKAISAAIEAIRGKG